MHPELTQLLHDVWRAKTNILLKVGRNYNNPDENDAIWHIYDLYTGIQEQQLDVPPSVYLPFLQQLAALENKIQLAPERQYSNDDWIQFNIGQMNSIFIGAEAANNSPRPWTQQQATAFEEGEKTAVAFLHYRKKAQAVTTERIYLNIKRERRATVFDRIIGDLYTGPNENTGISNAKLAGPIDRGRADTVVIYLDSSAAVQKALARIKYWQVNMGYSCHFNASVPKLTTPEANLVGVATAQEPPSIYIRKEGGDFKTYQLNQSYGFYRASLIFEALYQSHNKTEQAFATSVQEHFRKGGIDPDKPALQGPV